MRHMCVRSHSSASGEGLLVYLLKAVSAERTKCTVPAVSARAPGAKAPASARMLASTAARRAPRPTQTKRAIIRDPNPLSGPKRLNVPQGAFGSSTPDLLDEGTPVVSVDERTYVDVRTQDSSIDLHKSRAPCARPSSEVSGMRGRTTCGSYPPTRAPTHQTVRKQSTASDRPIGPSKAGWTYRAPFRRTGRALAGDCSGQGRCQAVRAACPDGSGSSCTCQSLRASKSAPPESRPLSAIARSG